MGKLTWCKRVPRAALEEMADLNLQQRGGFITILDLIFDTENNLRDDDRFLAGFMGCDVRIAKRIKLELISLGKLFIEDGKVRNVGAGQEVRDAIHRMEAAREAANIKHEKSKLDSNNLNDLADAPAVRRHMQPTPTSTVTEESSYSRTDAAPEQTGAGNEKTSILNGNGNGKSSPYRDRVTIQDPEERINRFAKWLAHTCHISWQTIAAAQDGSHKDHAYALAKCRKIAREKGKGWPLAWPTDRDSNNIDIWKT